MLYRGRNLDAVSLWSKWVDFSYGTEQHGFSSLVRCPNPEHHTEKKHFQINLDQPLVHCFANCGISGTYEKAISIIEGINEREARKLILKSCTVSKSTSSNKRRYGVSKSRNVRARVENEAEIVSFSTLPRRS